MTEYGDSDLIRLWQGGKEQAFAELYKRHVTKLISIALSKTNDRDIAEELVQDSFIKFYRHKDSIAPDTTIFAYLYVILKNRLLNYYRSQLVQQKYENYLITSQPSEDNSLIENIETRELERQLYDEIAKLPEKCKAVFLLSRKDNLSNKEIAAKLSISENTVEQHMRKALGRLRSSLGHYLEVAIVLYLLGR